MPQSPESFPTGNPENADAAVRTDKNDKKGSTGITDPGPACAREHILAELREAFPDACFRIYNTGKYDMYDKGVEVVRKKSSGRLFSVHINSEQDLGKLQALIGSLGQRGRIDFHCPVRMSNVHLRGPRVFFREYVQIEGRTNLADVWIGNRDSIVIESNKGEDPIKISNCEMSSEEIRLTGEGGGLVFVGESFIGGPVACRGNVYVSKTSLYGSIDARAVAHQYLFFHECNIDAQGGTIYLERVEIRGGKISRAERMTVVGQTEIECAMNIKRFELIMDGNPTIKSYPPESYEYAHSSLSISAIKRLAGATLEVPMPDNSEQVLEIILGSLDRPIPSQKFGTVEINLFDLAGLYDLYNSNGSVTAPYPYLEKLRSLLRNGYHVSAVLKGRGGKTVDLLRQNP